MAQYGIEAIRNVALVGHGGCGKTTLAEQALHLAGATKRLGGVDQKNSNLDFDDEERQRGFTIDSTVAHCRWEGALLRFVDAPGYPDFIAGAIGTLKAVETALVVVNATAGIEVNTRKMWEAAGNEGIARAVVLNRMDLENVDFATLVERVQSVFGAACIPFMLPIMKGGFKGVVDVLTFSGDAPDGVVGDPSQAREALIEKVVETNEPLMERYLNEEKISPDELTAACRRAVAGGVVAPIFCCAGLPGIGVKELCNALVKYLPSPADIAPRKATKGEAEVELRADPSAPLAAFVFKSVTDPFVGKMSFVRVYSGTLKTDSAVYDARTEKSEKVAQLLRPFGKETETVPDAIPGDLVVIAKLEGVALYDTLCSNGDSVVVARPALPTPMVSLAVSPKSRGDEQRLSVSLEKLVQEDPTFRVSRDPQTHEMVVSGMSTLHLDVMLDRLKRRFNVEVTTKEPKIPYRETITIKGEAQHRHKKQTGGHGQFGEVWLKLEPLPRGAGFEFADEVVGATIPTQYIPSVEKGIRKTLVKGVLADCPVDDVRAIVYYGKSHPVDSSDAAFQIAASQAFKKGFMACKPVLLEPVVNVEITVPSQYMGDISGNLVSRRGRIVGMESLGEMQVIKAQAPLSEVTRYATELRSLTGGQGYFTMEFSHYDVVPAHIAEPIVAAAKKPEQEEE